MSSAPDLTQAYALSAQVQQAAKKADRMVCTEAQFLKFAQNSVQYRRLSASGGVGVRLKRANGPYMVHNMVFVRSRTVAETVQQEYPDDKKKCSGPCGEVKPKTEFYSSHPDTREGLQSWCKECTKARAKQSYRDRKAKKNAG